MKITLFREIIEHYAKVYANISCIHCGELINFIRDNESKENSAERKIAQIIPNIYNQGKVKQIAEIAGYQVENYVICTK